MRTQRKSDQRAMNKIPVVKKTIPVRPKAKTPVRKKKIFVKKAV